jgi:hypothetical protein
MKLIRDVSATDLLWVQPQVFTRTWELRSGDEVVANLNWERMTGSLATATSADGQWTFKRTGFLNVRVHIRKAGSDQDIAVFYPKWTGSGTLELADGSRALWYSKGFFQAQWGWKTEQDTDIMTFRSTAQLLKHGATLHVDPAGASRHDLSLLALFGFYLTVMISEDAAASIVIIS